MNRLLKDIGEFELIRRISGITSTGSSVLKGIGDDCAVIRYKKDKHLLFTSDMILEDVHFLRKGTKPQAIGHKALAVNISDIAACAGIPRWALVSIGMPKDISLDFVRSMYKGMEALARRFGVTIAGGDTNLSDKIVISVALVGEVEKNLLVLREGARSGDAIIITGPLVKRPNHLTFTPEIKNARYLAKRFCINSMIDISDGFLADLNHILEASKKGAVVYENDFRSFTGSMFSQGLLGVGEQFKLIATMPKRYVKYLPKGFYCVGEIKDKASGIVFIDRRSNKKYLTPKGYSHF